MSWSPSLAGGGWTIAMNVQGMLLTHESLIGCFAAFGGGSAMQGGPLSLTVANLDHFKAVNLAFGHLVGDEVLATLSQRLHAHTTAQRAIARIGGDLFTILERCDLIGARHFADMLRQEIARAVFPKGVRLTACFGIAEARAAMPFEQLLGNAEACLYAAKAIGPDTVVDEAEFSVMAEAAEGDALFDNDNKIRVLTDRFGRALQLRSRRLVDGLRLEAERDGLTGLFNRRYFDRRLAHEFEIARKSARPLSLVLLDLDHFGQVNRTYGHPAGDDVLRAFAAILEESVRPSDWGARYGGEEFCIVLPNTRSADAAIVAERVRLKLESQVTSCRDGRKFSVTVSQGIAESDAQDLCPTDIVERASDRVRRAKRDGRNRICA